jgi:BirA family biotin operon repressor/biotin-[acetyl-CoA-carboxylase] ligase
MSGSSPVPQELTEALAAVAPRLGALAHAVTYFESIGSTNDVAATLAARGDAEGAVVIADAQTSGRGRRGRTWFSPPGAGLYVSIVLAPARARTAPDRATTLLTLTAGVALAEGIARATGLVADIKWPNDLLVERRKLAGILAEGVASPSSAGVQSVVLGYGINVGRASYPAELGDRVTSIESELGRPIDRFLVCAETIASLAERYRALLDGDFDAILDAWRRRAPGSRGATVSWDTLHGIGRGTTIGIDELGALLVRTADGVERLVAGEVRWD